MEENTFDTNNINQEKSCIIKKYKIFVYILLVVIFLFLFNLFFLSTPKDFPVNSIYVLEKGQVLSKLSDDFFNKNIIKSKIIFKSLVYLVTFGEGKIIEGTYGLYEKQGLVKLVFRITNGDTNILPIRITIPEGLNSMEIADIFSKKIPIFKKDIFIGLVEKEKLEGYLFPDTYLIFPNSSESEVIKIMNDNFNNKIKEIDSEIKRFGKKLDDVIKMASIVEGEARKSDTRRIVAGILWYRLSIGMPLQVDSSFKYINGKTSETLSLEDLKIESPYNSYTNKGLPPTPISNPGLGSIRDTINPTNTKYLYFLTDKEGNMHYAFTHEEHVANKNKYLR
jgi:UPF0755 protein